MTRRSYASKVKKGIIAEMKPALKDLIQTHFPYALVHSCGEIAFFLSKEPQEGQIIEPDDVIYPDGGKPVDAICYSCQGRLMHDDFKNVKNIRSVQ